MLKKWLFFPCVFLCVFMLSTSPVVAQKGSLSLVPSPMSSPGVGEEFELSVNITGGQSVAGYQVTVAFDATALEYVSSKNGDYLPVGAFWVPAKHQGSRVVLAATALGGESQGNGTLAVVTFKVKAVKASTVSLSEALLSNKLGQTLRPQVTGAEITKPTGISIPDVGLADAIRAALGLNAGDPITADAMLRLTTLRASKLDIIDLTGLEHATNLQTLNLYGNRIVDVGPLLGLTNLQELRLGANPINVGALSGLTNLQRLSLGDRPIDLFNQIVDVGALSGLTNLTELSLSINGIVDVGPLSGLTNLTVLLLDSNQIVDVGPLSGLTNLQRLWLGGNQIVDVNPLEGLTNLTWLDLADNQIVDVSPLAGLVNLENLFLIGNPLTDTSPLASLTKLIDVDVEITPTDISIPDAGLADAIRAALGLNAGDPITADAIQTLKFLTAHGPGPGLGISNLTGLEHATNLTQLDLTGNDIVNVSSLSGLTNLTDLNLFNNDIVNVSSLSGLTNLTVLSLDNNKIVDVSSLSGLTNLTDLNLFNNDIVNVSSLSGLTNLTVLSLDNNKIVDVSSLSGLTNLTDLNLVDNQISDVTPLAALVNLERLYLKRNPLTDTSPLASLTKLIDVDVEITGSKLPADVDGDGIVNIVDLVLVGTNFGKAGPNDADVNGDGIVNIVDLVLVGGAFGQKQAAPMLRSEVLETFTTADVQVWLASARNLDTTHPAYQRGIMFLEHLLAVLSPERTVLLSNYPNPFNPETWIPYHLAAATDVQITIYDTTGRVVRHLDLGHQAAGYYTEKSRAAYWDGKNALGESVASGVYFYQLQTSSVSLLRKMVILK